MRLQKSFNLLIFIILNLLMTKTICLFLLLCTTLLAIDIKFNNKTLINQKPKLIDSVPNGQKLLIGDLNDPQRNILYIINVKGTPFEMGQAYGKLLKTELNETIKLFYDYYMNDLEGMIQKKVPKFLAKELIGPVKFNLRSILKLNVMITKKYTNKRYYEEINGIAKGSGIHASEFSMLNIFPELIKAACTVAGVWGKATENGQTIHMRALDWDYQNPISKYPVATVYHPSNKSWHPHINFAWAGFVGSLTGMSDKLSIGEKVWLPRYPVQTTRYGNPWTYVFRDILYDAHDLKSAINILETTHRTCTIHIGIASAEDKSFRMFEYAYQTLNIYDDQNYTSYGSYHPKLPGVAYFDKHVQPSKDSQAGDVLSSYMYGHWEMESLWRMLGTTHQTGDTQLAVFNIEEQEVLISYSQYNGKMKAFERRPIYLNAAELFEDF